MAYYDLRGKHGETEKKIDPYDLTVNRGDDILSSRFTGKGIIPIKEGYTFKGWIFTWEDMDEKPLPISGAIWDFDFCQIRDGKNVPDESNGIFITVWEPVETPSKMLTDTTKPEPTKAELGKVMPKTGDNFPLALATLLLISTGALTIGVPHKDYLNK